jgi:hypothetical protein
LNIMLNIKLDFFQAKKTTNDGGFF